MTPTTMRGPDYLRTLENETIERAYQQTGKGYTRAGDEAAAALLQQIAAVQGVTVEIRGVTLGKERSARGLVAFKSPRGPLPAAGESEATTKPQAAPAQPGLPIVPRDSHHHGDPLWAIVGQLKILNGHLDQLRRVVALSFPPAAQPEAKPEYPKAVGE
jgi:hypothetical protein